MTLTDYYCPNCGKQTVWEDDQYDHNVENGFYCLFCITTWSMPFFHVNTNAKESKQIMTDLKNMIKQ